MSTTGAAGAADLLVAAAAVPPAVDALVAQPLSALLTSELQRLVLAVAPQAARLVGWLRAVEGELDVRGGGQVPTEDGKGRSVAGWWPRCGTRRRRRWGASCGCRRRCGACRGWSKRCSTGC